MKKASTKWFAIIFPLLIGVIIIYYQFTTLSFLEIQNIKQSFTKANYNYIYISFVLSTLGYWLRAYRWKYSLNHMGYYTHFKNNFATVCISYLVNLTIPRSGEISRAALLKKYENVPFDKGFGTIIAERIVDFLIFLIFVAIGFVLQFETLYNFLLKRNVSFKSILLFAIIGFLLFIAFVLIWIYAEWNIVKKLKKKLAGLTEGVFSVYKMEKRWQYILYSFLIWITYLLMFYITIFALPETANLSFSIVIMGFIFGSLAVGFTNGGLGAFPLSIALILSLYGISNQDGTAFGWLVWVSQTLFTIVMGLISYIMLPIQNKDKKL